MKRYKNGGGWHAIKYALKLAGRMGIRKTYQLLTAKNACKTWRWEMGGQKGGMRNEIGHWPEICKKSLQAMAADCQDGISEDFFAKYSLLQMKGMTPRELEHSGRLVFPLYAGPKDRHYRPISWEDALNRVSAKLAATEPDRSFFYFSGRSSNEAAFLLHLFARVYGTNNVNNCSYFCHQASGVALGNSIGSGTATIQLEDLDGCDLFVLIGGNPASNHPRLMRSLMMIRRNGGKVVVVNPIKETGLVRFRVPSDVRSMLFSSAVATDYVQPHIGGDSAFLAGVAKSILARKATNGEFLANSTEGYEAYVEEIARLSWDDVELHSGCSREEIERIAEQYANAKNAVFAWTMGITHHLHGVQNVHSIINLALLRGMVGRPNAGLLPIRGHSNVQGIGSMGVSPALKQAVFDRLQSHFSIKLPTTSGLDTLACINAADRGELNVGICLGGNLYGSAPDADLAARALRKLETVVYISTTLNTGHAHGLGQETIILPVLARDEELQPTTQESMFNYVRMSDGGMTPPKGTRSEISVISSIARGVLGDNGAIDWKDLEQHSSIRRAIAKIIPGYEQLGTMDQTKEEFQIPGRTFHASRFGTPSGKAKFKVYPLPKLERKENELRLMTIRSEGQFNTVVYEEEDVYRGQERRDVILMNGDDIQRMGLKADQRVKVFSATGTLRGILVREIDIKSGCAAMYYPEANVLVPATADPESRTPAFKSVLVSVAAEASNSDPINAVNFIPSSVLIETAR